VRSSDQRPAAVLFDLDGTLVDSEKVWGIALAELAARYGGTLTDAVRARMVGASSTITMAILLDHLDQPWRDPAEGSAWLDERVLELYTDGLVWRPGAPELLSAVRGAGIPTALVTNTNRPLVNVILPMVGPFDAVVCGNEVRHGKPDPEPYAKAVALLGARPADCVAIEDSPTGIASARGAGCVVVGVPNEVPLSEVDSHVVPSLLDLDVPALRELFNE
jgi:HAD superfamily hydrolase (TIGR01509 family)